MSTTAQIIESIETIIVDLPLVREQRFAAKGARSQSIVYIFVKTRDGIEGVGESATPSGPWWGGEAPETIKLMIDIYLTPLLLGEDAFNIDALMAKMDGKVFGNNFAKAGLEMALLDIQGKALNQPVYNLLGGKVRDSLPMSWPLATGDPKAEIEEAEGNIADKLHNIFKLKMGFLDPKTDVDRACTVARALRDHASIRADVNERWDEETTSWAVPRMIDAGLALIEQPMPRWNLEAAARLTAAINIPHLLDESVCTEQDMLRVAKTNAGNLVSLKIMKSGGIRRTKLIADMALAAGIPLYMGTFLEPSYGAGANMQLCATLRDLPYGGELAGGLLVAEDICETSANYQDFELHLQEGVGMAMKIDPDKLRAFRRDREYSIHAFSK
ncbi:MAG: muconate cycloisomerase family protein [Halieaceae bacterium]|nr:muconate cycloisomerase family protein [Halieaceae bacterium]